jgi:hypothetical protein
MREREKKNKIKLTKNGTLTKPNPHSTLSASPPNPQYPSHNHHNMIYKIPGFASTCKENEGKEKKR